MIWNWFKKFTSDEDDIYRPKERLIYSYHDGKELRKADPMTLYKRLLAKGPELGVDMKVMASPLKEAPQAHERFLDKIRDVFAVKRYEEGGLTEVETLDLFDHFLEYAERLKKKGSPPPTLLTVTPDPSASSPVENPTTPNTSDSGLTANVPSIVSPPPPPSEPASPSAS